MAQNETFLTWLNDAHAMEQSLCRTLESHIEHARDNDEVRTKLEEHLEQTRNHAELVRGCIERLGGEVSEVKSWMASVMGAMQGGITGPAEDQLIKDALADYAAENFEIASYIALIAAADEIGDTETAEVAEQILEDEQEMAAWLEDNLPQLVQQHLQRERVAH